MKTLMRIVGIILAVFILVILGLRLGFNLINTSSGELVSGGETRRYLLYVPDSYDPAKPTPLVVSIHGFSDWPAHHRDTTRWNDLADKEGFIVVYPMGVEFPLRWRATTADPAVDPMQDVNFLSDLTEQLEKDYNIDPQRIYYNGFSNGGGMTFLMSCRLSERIAAVGLVSGAYLQPWEDCNPQRPLPAIVFHGTDDPIVPYLGGPSRMFDIPFPAIDDWVARLGEHNGCDPNPATLDPVGSVSGIRYDGCEQDAEVIYYSIAGGGHNWPGGEPLPVWITGATNTDIDATRLMWEFYLRHPLNNQ